MSENNTPQIDIIIDCREDKLINALESDSLKKECGHLLFDVKQLDVGDIVYKVGDQFICLIERKTMDDYASSITDKRTKNQSLRISQLRKDDSNIQIIYLIEGPFIHKDYKYRNGITRDSMYSSMINRVVKDHFTIYRTADIYDTALIVTKLYDKLQETLKKNSISADERIEYLKTIKLAKKENMTPENCYLCQLSQIPGVSIDVANIISTTYKSMTQLILAYERLHEIDEKQILLSGLMIPIANNKTRRLGNVLSNRIYEYLCYIPETKMEKITLKLKNIP